MSLEREGDNVGCLVEEVDAGACGCVLDRSSLVLLVLLAHPLRDSLSQFGMKETEIVNCLSFLALRNEILQYFRRVPADLDSKPQRDHHHHNHDLPQHHHPSSPPLFPLCCPNN